MSLNCNNVQDYVTLYKDNALSSETKQEIELHLRGCEKCKDFYKEYDNLNTSTNNINIENENDKKYAVIAKKISKKKKTVSIFTALGMVAVVAATAYISHIILPKDK